MMQLEHTGLVVKDLDKQVAFYRDLIGLKVTREAEVAAPSGGGHTALDGVRRKLVFLSDDCGQRVYLQCHRCGHNEYRYENVSGQHGKGQTKDHRGCRRY